MPTTSFPSDFLCRRNVWFLWNLIGHANAAREKTRLTRALIFASSEQKWKWSLFDILENSWIWGNSRVSHFPWPRNFHPQIYFRIFDHFCEHLSSRASSLNEGNSEWDPISSSEGNTPAPSKRQTPQRRKKSSGWGGWVFQKELFGPIFCRATITKTPYFLKPGRNLKYLIDILSRSRSHTYKMNTFVFILIEIFGPRDPGP